LEQREAKWRKQERENEDLKIQLEETSDQYDIRKCFLCVLLSKYKELEHAKHAQQLTFETERSMLMADISETKDQLDNSLAEIKQLKIENAQMKETINRDTDRYKDLANVLTASKNELHQKIAELYQQNDDLEMTLVMIRNSWNQTANVMESDANKNTSKLERLTNEAKSYQLQFENLNSESETKEQMIDNLQQRQMQMDMQISNLELKCAAQSVENARVKTQLNFLQVRLANVRQWILQLLQQGIIQIDTQRFPITEENLFDTVVQHSLPTTLSFKSTPYFKDSHLSLDP
ncbi:hypothetical protein RFI_16120, partial [Reticulomyxa filosa]